MLNKQRVLIASQPFAHPRCDWEMPRHMLVPRPIKDFGSPYAHFEPVKDTIMHASGIWYRD